MSNRLSPIEEPFPENIAALLAQYPQQGGYLLSLFRTFANSERFLRKGVGNFLDEASPLNLRDRELVILRTTANLQCAYEWGVHVAAFARRAGLNEQQVAATRMRASDADCWEENDQLILRGVDELCREGRVKPDTYALWAERFAKEQQLEMLAVCGAYHTISFVANTAALPNEPFAPHFPDHGT